MGASIDGRIASHPNESDADRKRYGFTNEADRAHLDHLLAECDAVIVGGHSVNVSGGVMEVQRKDGQYPTWILCSNRGYPEDAPIWSHPNTPKWMVSKKPLSGGQISPSARALHYGESSMAEFIRAGCEAEGFERVLLFGGGIINQQFYQTGAVDELILTVCPVVVGRESGVPVVAPDLDNPVRLTLASVEKEGDLAFLHYLVEP